MSVWIRDSRIAPWAGLLLGLIAWLIDQQAGLLLVSWTCAVGHPTPLLLLGLGTLVLAGSGLLFSWKAMNAGGAEDASADSRRFISALSMGLAVLFMLAILAQTLAALLLTGCEE